MTSPHVCDSNVRRGRTAKAASEPSRRGGRRATLAARARPGDGAVVDDNAQTISAMLADYNAGIPRPAGESGGFCNLGAGMERRPAPAWLALLLGALLYRARKTRPAGGR